MPEWIAALWPVLGGILIVGITYGTLATRTKGASDRASEAYDVADEACDRSKGAAATAKRAETRAEGAWTVIHEMRESLAAMKAMLEERLPPRRA